MRSCSAVKDAGQRAGDVPSAGEFSEAGRSKQPLVAWFVDDQHRPGTLIEDGVADASEQE
jgi:hypothetical protein